MEFDINRLIDLMPNFVGLVLLAIILYRVNMRQADTVDRQDDTIKQLATRCLELQNMDILRQNEARANESEGTQQSR
jgi:hypothetical protein